jgi:hypothetical protein
MTLLIESDPELRCPDAFPDTDSKGFASILFSPEVEVLERGLDLDLAPLKYAATDTSPATEEMIREDWGEEAEEMIAQARRHSELAWHTPDAFLECLGQLAERLERGGRKLPAAVCRAIDPSGHYRSYLQSGVFYSDVAGCLAAIRSLKEQGARRVRFFAF